MGRLPLMKMLAPGNGKRTVRRHLLVIGFVAVMSAAALWRVRLLEVDADMLSLLPRDDPALVAYREAQASLPTARALHLVLSPGTPAQAAKIAAEVAALEQVSEVLPAGAGPRGGTVLAALLTVPESDIDGSEVAVRGVRDILARHDPDAGLTGSPAFLVESREALSDDLRRAMVLAVAGVAVFFLFFYRAGWFALAALVPIGVGILWGLAGVSLMTDKLTLLAAMVPTLLVGLGIDYSIHLLQATCVQLDAGAAKREAIARAWAAVIRPLTVGAVTTAAAFLSLSFAHLRGLSDMGLAGAVTTFTVWLATVLITPLLLAGCPARWLRREGVLNRSLLRLAPLARRATWPVLIAGIAITAGALVGIGRLGFDADISRLGNPNLQALKLQEELAETTGTGAAPMLLTFPSIDAAQRFKAASGTGSEAARRVGRLELWPTGTGAVAVLHPAGNPFNQAEFEGLMDSISAVAGESGFYPPRVAGAAVVNARLCELLRRDLPRTVCIALGAVALVLVVGMGGMRGALLALVPLACGLIWTGGLMGFAHAPLSVMSVAIAPLILGVGVDDGVHMLVAWRRSGGRLEHVYRQTGIAVVATTATTVAAFASLIPSGTEALTEFGWQASVGLAVCMIASLTVLPAACVACRFARGASASSQ